MKKFNNQIGCDFVIDNEHYIYEGVFKSEATGEYNCNGCKREIKKGEWYYLFNSIEGYNEGTFESRIFGTSCINNIIQLGYTK